MLGKSVVLLIAFTRRPQTIVSYTSICARIFPLLSHRLLESVSVSCFPYSFEKIATYLKSGTYERRHTHTHSHRLLKNWIWMHTFVMNLYRTPDEITSMRVHETHDSKWITKIKSKMRSTLCVAVIVVVSHCFQFGRKLNACWVMLRLTIRTTRYRICKSQSSGSSSNKSPEKKYFMWMEFIGLADKKKEEKNLHRFNIFSYLTLKNWI